MSLLPMLKGEAQPCLNCEAQTCAQVIGYAPEVTQAFARDDIPAAYAAIRAHNVLPEMSARVCPSFTRAENVCIRKRDGGEAVPIREIFHAVAQLAREDGLTAVKLGPRESGRKVAVIGGGPAGISGTARLLEYGHHVVLFERDERLGGAPDKLYRDKRYQEAQTEIMPILQRALNAHRLEIRYNRRLGKHVRIKELMALFDAVLLATGLWQEYEFATDAEEVVDAITFLREVKTGERDAVPQRVAILAGGDGAMDSAAAAHALGAQELYIVYPDKLENMHWHMPDGWFEETGAKMLAHTQPLGYEGGLQVCGTHYVGEELYQVEGSEDVLPVELVVAATGITMAAPVKEQLQDLKFSPYGLVAEQDYATSVAGIYVAGALMNGGLAVSRCVQDGMTAADQIHQFLQDG